MLATCKQLRFEGGCTPSALLAEFEEAGCLWVESVASVGDATIVAVRGDDWTEERGEDVARVVAGHVSEPHPVFGAVAYNHALHARRFPPVEAPPHVREMIEAARAEAASRPARKRPR